MQKLIETGERERLKDLLRERLIQCGWRDELKVFGSHARARAHVKLVSYMRGFVFLSRDDIK